MESEGELHSKHLKIIHLEKSINKIITVLYMKLYKSSGNLFVFLLLLFSTFNFAKGQDSTSTQPTIIKGRLTDEQTGEALIGAFVYIKGTKTGAQTDIEGNFEIKANQEPPFTLAVSYIGYQNKEIEVYEVEHNVEVKLHIQELVDEVVVIG